MDTHYDALVMRARKTSDALRQWSEQSQGRARRESREVALAALRRARTLLDRWEERLTTPGASEPHLREEQRSSPGTTTAPGGLASATS